MICNYGTSFIMRPQSRTAFPGFPPVPFGDKGGNPGSVREVSFMDSNDTVLYSLVYLKKPRGGSCTGASGMRRCNCGLIVSLIERKKIEMRQVVKNKVLAKYTLKYYVIKII